MKRYRIYVYDLDEEFIYEVIKEDDADATLIKLIEAINRYGRVRVRCDIRLER